jgi:two-component system NtrC family response regulator
LNVVHIHLPPLRERPDDIPLLVNHFLGKHTRGDHEPPLRIAPEALRTLFEYPWPGNVRELENVIERTVILSSNEQIGETDLPLEIREGAHHPESLVAVAKAGVPKAEKTGPDGELIIEPGEKLPQWGTNQRQQRALSFVKTNGFITNKYYSKLNGISERQALRELTDLVEMRMLVRMGKGRACRYVLPEGEG